VLEIVQKWHGNVPKGRDAGGMTPGDPREGMAAMQLEPEVAVEIEPLPQVRVEMLIEDVPGPGGSCEQPVISVELRPQPEAPVEVEPEPEVPVFREPDGADSVALEAEAKGLLPIEPKTEPDVVVETNGVDEFDSDFEGERCDLDAEEGLCATEGVLSAVPRGFEDGPLSPGASWHKPKAGGDGAWRRAHLAVKPRREYSGTRRPRPKRSRRRRADREIGVGCHGELLDQRLEPDCDESEDSWSLSYSDAWDSEEYYWGDSIDGDQGPELPPGRMKVLGEAVAAMT
jgi:hypothetical protein